MKKFNFKKPDFTKAKEKFKDIRQDKKKLAIWICSGVAVIALIVCAVIFVPGAVSGTSNSNTASSNKVTTTTKTKKSNTSTTKKESTASASAEPSASADSTAETASSESESKDSTADSSDTASSNSSVSNSKGASSNTSSNNGSNTSSSSNNKSSNSSSSKSCSVVHHDATGHYENITTQQWVQDSAAWDETVVDQAAYDEITGSVYKCECGQTFSTDGDLEYHIAVAHGGSSGYTTVPSYTHHDAVTHVVHHDATGHYETVVTGQQWVQDSAAWDETVCN